MSKRRPIKTVRLNYGDIDSSPSLALLGEPNEIRLNVNKKTFVSVREAGVTIAPGQGKQINLQAMSHNVRYGGMIQDLPFPMSMMPVTTFNPFPKQFFAPPLKQILPIIRQISILATAFI